MTHHAASDHSVVEFHLMLEDYSAAMDSLSALLETTRAAPVQPHHPTNKDSLAVLPNAVPDKDAVALNASLQLPNFAATSLPPARSLILAAACLEQPYHHHQPQPPVLLHHHHQQQCVQTILAVQQTAAAKMM